MSKVFTNYSETSKCHIFPNRGNQDICVCFIRRNIKDCFYEGWDKGRNFCNMGWKQESRQWFFGEVIAFLTVKSLILYSGRFIWSGNQDKYDCGTNLVEGNFLVMLIYFTQFFRNTHKTRHYYNTCFLNRSNVNNPPVADISFLQTGTVIFFKFYVI